MDYGHLKMNIVDLLEERGISKNKICKDLDLPRPNFNRYCKNKYQRIDAQLIIKLLYYFDCDINDLITYIPPNHKD